MGPTKKRPGPALGSSQALPPLGPYVAPTPGSQPRPSPSRPARAGTPPPHLVEGEELLLELFALRVSALPPEPKFHHLGFNCGRRARRRHRRCLQQDAPYGPAGPEAQAGRQEVRQADQALA